MGRRGPVYDDLTLYLGMRKNWSQRSHDCMGNKLWIRKTQGGHCGAWYVNVGTNCPLSIGPFDTGVLNSRTGSNFEVCACYSSASKWFR